MTKSKIALVFFSLGALLFLQPLAGAAEKVRFTTNAVVPSQHLPSLAANEQRTWQKYGVDAEWVAIRGAAVVYRAAAAGRLDAGIGLAIGMMTGVARAVPLVIVSSTGKDDFFMWVPAKSPIASPKDLKGKKIAVTSLGGSIHAFSQAVAAGLGIDQKVKFVATGGVPESIAAIKTGGADMFISSLASMAKLKVAGEFREILSVSDYLPKDFAVHVLFVRKGFLKEDRNTSKGVALAVRDAVNFIRTNPAWALAKLKSEFGHSEKAAKILWGNFQWPVDSKITAAEVEGVRKFAIQYGLAKAEDFPPLAEYFVPILEQ